VEACPGGAARDYAERVICLTTRELWLRLVDATAWFSHLDPDLLDRCLEDLTEARNTLTPDSKYLKSVKQRVEMVARMAAGEKIDVVLVEAVGRHAAEAKSGQ
jgi:hypothetical protein